MPSSGRWMVLFAGEFRRLRAASDFARGGKVTKTPPGTAPDEHFVLIVAFPRTPIYGGYPLEQAESFRRAKSEWASEFPPGHWALGLQKLPLLRFHSCAWVVQTNVPGSVSAVGATLAVARSAGRRGRRPLRKSQKLPLNFTGTAHLGCPA